MANNFRIIISAQDKATASIRKVNESMSKIGRPVAEVKKSFSALSKEVAKNPVAKAVAKIGSAAKGTAMALGKVAGPMLGITGIGVVAGLVELTNQWGRLGVEIKNTSSVLGSSTTDLQGMRGAAKLAGLSSEELTGGLLSVRQTLQDAKWGRNQPALNLMNRLGIAFKYTADGSVDAVAGLKDIADAIAEQKDLGAKHTIAQAFGVEALLPMLMKGRKGIEEYIKDANDLGAIPSQDAIDRAEKLGNAWNRLGTAAKGAGNNMADALTPLATNAVNNITNYFKKANDSTNSKDKNSSPSLPFKYLAGGIPRMVYDLFSGQDANQSSSGKISYPIDKNAPLGIRSNNPLNMQPGGKEAIFPTMEEGIRAGVGNILKNYQGLTLAQYVHKYAPGNGAGNTPESEAAYLADLSRQTGVAPNQIPNLNDSKTLAPLVSAQIQHENGAGTYDKATMDAAVSHVIVEFKNAPPGISATARSSNGASMPVKIASAMPTLVSP